MLRTSGSLNAPLVPKQLSVLGFFPDFRPNSKGEKPYEHRGGEREYVFDQGERSLKYQVQALLRGSDTNTMSVRRLVYKLMVLSPALLMAGLSVRERTYVDEYLIPAQGPVDHARMNQYVPVIRETRPVLARPPSSLLMDGHNDRIRRTGELWAQAADDRVLGPIHPAFYGDSIREGAKSEIFAARGTLVSYLSTLGRWEDAAGNVERALNDYLLALRVANVGKFSDLEAVASSNLQQRGPLESLGALVPAMSPAQKRFVEEQLTRHRKAQKSTDPLAVRARRQYAVYAELKGRQILPIQEAENLGPSAKRHLLASASADAPYVESKQRMAVLSQETHLRVLDQVQAALSGKRPFPVAEPTLGGPNATPGPITRNSGRTNAG